MECTQGPRQQLEIRRVGLAFETGTKRGQCALADSKQSDGGLPPHLRVPAAKGGRKPVEYRGHSRRIPFARLARKLTSQRVRAIPACCPFGVTPIQAGHGLDEASLPVRFRRSALRLDERAATTGTDHEQSHNLNAESRRSGARKAAASSSLSQAPIARIDWRTDQSTNGSSSPSAAMRDGTETGSPIRPSAIAASRRAIGDESPSRRAKAPVASRSRRIPAERAAWRVCRCQRRSVLPELCDGPGRCQSSREPRARV